MKIEIGDWVRFYLGGKFVTGVVEYIRPRKAWQSSDEICTDAGSIAADHVLERRSKALEASR
jgi:hypothetical protein